MKRRDLLKRTAAAMGTAVVATRSVVTPAQQVSGPTGTAQAGRRFRAFIRTAGGASVREVRLHPLRDDMVLIRTEATQCCYTIVNQALGTGAVGGAGGTVPARILGHGGVGVRRHGRVILSIGSSVALRGQGCGVRERTLVGSGRRATACEGPRHRRHSRQRWPCGICTNSIERLKKSSNAHSLRQLTSC